MKAGDLNRRVTVQVRTETRGITGEMVPSWADLFTVWMSKKDINATTRVTATQPVAEVDTIFQARWRPAYQSIFADTHRLVLDGRVYKIAGLKELGYRDGVEIAASARAEA